MNDVATKIAALQQHDPAAARLVEQLVDFILARTNGAAPALLIGDSAPVTEAQACAYVQVFNRSKDPVKQFQRWARRWGVPVKRVGRQRLYERKILDAFLSRENWTGQHRPGNLPTQAGRVFRRAR